MDSSKLVEILRGTIHGNQKLREKAEEYLGQVHSLIGFTPLLLQVIMQNEVPLAVRQAGGVYLKNLCSCRWQKKKAELGEPVPFSIHEQDRALIRASIVDAIVQAPDLIRVQLCICVRVIIRNDFPKRWPDVVDKIHFYLQNHEPNNWMGALLCLYQLIKTYEYCSAEKRVALMQAMNLLLPIMYIMIANLQADQSEQSLLLQKQILKCFFTLIKYKLNLDLLTKDIFTKWMEVLRRAMEAPVPESTMQVSEDERKELPCWKIKKWAGHTLLRVFERYGSLLNAHEEYVQFAEWHLATFTTGILEVFLRLLDQYRNKVYVSPRVLHQIISYIEMCVWHTHSWNFLKPHMFAIIQDVLLPLMSFSEDEEQLWNTDPHEYIRDKYDIFEDLLSPVNAARGLLNTCCKKRKEMLEGTVQLCTQVLTNQNGEFSPRQRDGAFHMIGTLNCILTKKQVYKEQIESLLSQMVFPEFQNPLGYMRARACWTLHCFADIEFKDDQVLHEAVRLSVTAFLNDPELPVKVEATNAIQTLLCTQGKVHRFLEPQIKAITTELLKLIRETENDNVSSVLEKIVPMYTEQLTPMAFEITDHLAITFILVIDADAGSEDKAITAMGLLNSMETVLKVMEDNRAIMAQLEKIVLRVVGHIMHHTICEYYEEVMSLLYNLTTKTISNDLWTVLEILYKVIEKDGFYEYFPDMMPVLHNYVTVDTKAFLANKNHILAIFNMCKAVLKSDAEEGTQLYAAKLLEVMVLQCTGKIDHYLPYFVELVLNSMTTAQGTVRKFRNTELRPMLLLVLVAMLHCNAPLLINILDKQDSIRKLPAGSIKQHFIKQWIYGADSFKGVHNRKLCILGICTLLEIDGPQIGPNTLRPNLGEVVQVLLPACIVLFEGLKRAYEARVIPELSDKESEDEDLLTSGDEDLGAKMAVNISKQTDSNINRDVPPVREYDSDDDESDYGGEDSAIESYTTCLDDDNWGFDAYIKFKCTIQGLSVEETGLYNAMMSGLTEQGLRQLNEIFMLADVRKAELERRRIEQSGGWVFSAPQQVPTKFNFSS